LGQKEMAMNGKNRIMIYGPKADGTAVQRDELAAVAHSITSSSRRPSGQCSSILRFEPCIDNFLCLGNNRLFGTFLKRCGTFGQRR
jgi:hypothetical protein